MRPARGRSKSPRSGQKQTKKDGLRYSKKTGRAIWIKPGWVRLNIHYTFDRGDMDFLLKAVEFAAESGHLFLHDYSFDWRTGVWRHLDFKEKGPELSLENDFRTRSVDLSRKASFRAAYFREARRLASRLEKTPPLEFRKDSAEIEDLKYFYYVHPA